MKFGTDGLRGVAGTELTPELALALGRAAARILGEDPSSEELTSRFLVGRDTRISGQMLQAAFAAGLAAAGAEVVDLGVIPTPGVAALCAARNCPGAVVSASHNRFDDNGIKLFSAGGRKLDDATQGKIEAALGASPPGACVVAGGSLSGGRIGRLSDDPGALGWYAETIAAALEGRRLEGVRMALDCGHGAAFEVAPQVFASLGADLCEVLGASPDGTNINAGCGSTDPSRLSRAVLATGADFGLAFDGDADRVIAVDAAGRLVDGDRLLALFATDLKARGRLRDSTVVVTVMTNLGFHRAMQAEGIAVTQTAVGDRYVLDALESGGWSLGGEQSGHVIFKDLATTGDGVLCGALLADLVARRRLPLAELAAASMERLPQVLRNVEVSDSESLAGAEPVWAEVAAVQASLGDSGRVLVRASGTERVVRVMVEAVSESEALSAAARLEAAVLGSLG